VASRSRASRCRRSPASCAATSAIARDADDEVVLEAWQARSDLRRRWTNPRRVVTWVSYQFPRSRPILEGEPIIVVQDGQVIERNLRRERLTVEDIAEEARKQQIAHIDEIRFAILENDGTISFIPKGSG
jgi:hypothetical protein